MPFREIKILEGNTTTHKLTLSDGGTSTVRRNDAVTWLINTPNVISFRIVKKGPTEIFVTPPPLGQAPRCDVRVRSGCPYIDYEYAIIWKDRGGLEHTHDPKLSVRPHLITVERVLLFFTACIVTLATCLMLNKKATKIDDEKDEQNLFGND